MDGVPGGSFYSARLLIKGLIDKGYNTYIFSQPPELPFGYTREDILIEKL